MGQACAAQAEHKSTRSLKYVHYAAVLVSVIFVFSDVQYGIGLRGLWTTRSLAMLAMLTGVLFYIVADKAVLNRAESAWFRLFFFLPALVGFVFCIPFYGTVSVVVVFGYLTEPASKIYYEDDQVRVYSSFSPGLGPSPVDVTVRYAIMERRIGNSPVGTNDVDSVAVLYEKNSAKILFYNRSNLSSASDIIVLPRQN